MNNSLTLQGNIHVTVGFAVPEKAKRLISGYLNMMEEKESSRFVVQGGIDGEGNPLYMDYQTGNKHGKTKAKASLISAVRKLQNFDEAGLKEIKFTIYTLD